MPFEINNSWWCCQWNFRIGFTPKEGLVIYSVAYVDGSRGRRPIAHRLSFVEMVVPYGDPNEPHYRKNAFDAGEDGLGKNAHSLKKVIPQFLISILIDILMSLWQYSLPFCAGMWLLGLHKIFWCTFHKLHWWCWDNWELCLFAWGGPRNSLETPRLENWFSRSKAIKETHCLIYLYNCKLWVWFLLALLSGNYIIEFSLIMSE